MAHNTMIKISNLSRSFGKKMVLNDLNLKVYDQEIFALLGHNGAGKTTTIRLLLGLIRPTTGCINIMGMDLRTHATTIRANTGAIFDSPGLYDNLSAFDNLVYYSKIHHIKKRDYVQRIQQQL